MNKKIFISTGEVSGDLHGSLLSKALLEESKKKIDRFRNLRIRWGKDEERRCKNSSRYYINQCNRNLGGFTSYSSNNKNSKKIL
jgi:lipid A disaccharide synthetase